MPIARGLMQIGRVNVYRTSCIFDRIEPTESYCGGGVIFYVSVNNLFPGVTVTGGTFDIINVDNNDIIASGNISAGSGTVSGYVNLSGALNLAVRYNGYNNQFSSSVSSPVRYNVSNVYTNTTIISPESSNYCYHEPLTIAAKVDAVDFGTSLFPVMPVPTGNVQFIFKQPITDLEYNIINLGEAELNGAGIATLEMPPNTGEVGVAIIVAYYLGDGCFESSFTTHEFNSIENDTTNIGVNTTTTGPLYTYTPINLTALVVGTDLPDPSDGSVHFSVTSGASTIDLGTYPVSSGTATTTIPAGTLTVGIWQATADYIPSSTQCYLGSSSHALRLVIST